MPSPVQIVTERIVDNVNRVLLGKRSEIFGWAPVA